MSSRLVSASSPPKVPNCLDGDLGHGVIIARKEKNFAYTAIRESRYMVQLMAGGTQLAAVLTTRQSQSFLPRTENTWVRTIVLARLQN